MTSLFGYGLEPDFDLGKERRKNWVGWTIVCASIVCAASLFWNFRFAIQGAQACIATIGCYGQTFYVEQKGLFRKLWLWKVILASVPLHVLYLAGLFWSDKMFPEVMTKAIFFIPVLILGAGIEYVLIQAIMNRFRPSGIEQAAAGPMPRT
jgi:hypothetical protein